MKLAEFIRTNREPILVEWEKFAATCEPACGVMDVVGLRDHANAMLTAIVEDLDTPQSHREQAEKSKGNAPVTAGDSAAEDHGSDRADSGFTIEQMVSEFRALRASVIRLWTKAKGVIDPADIDDLMRFNEAIDQALAESVTKYMTELGHSEEMFLAILGHDLRTPLGAVLTSSKFMIETKELVEPHLTLTSRIVSSATRMNHMVGDLLDFTRSRLGGGIPVVRTELNMEKVVMDVLDEIKAAYPDRKITKTFTGDLRGSWDCARISQALTNLMGNAIEHGSKTAAVVVAVTDQADGVSIAIRNQGEPITASQLNGIFNPMKRKLEGGVQASTGSNANLGLGLFIAERIVTAHHGRITAESSAAEGTTFTVLLPR